jgi:type IV pilus assembly protein PilB
MTPIKRIVPIQLGELLLERRIITQAQLDEAHKIQKEKGGLLGQILVMLGYVKEEDIAQVITVQYGFPFLALENYQINQETLKIIPENVARQYNLIPIDKIGNMLTVAMSNPLNLQAVEDIEMISALQVQIFVSTMSAITRAIDIYYGSISKR